MIVKKIMLKSVAVAAMIALAFPTFADSLVEVIAVTAQQRYPWNGMVDIVVTIRGESSDVASADCLFVATNCATEAAIPVEHITQKGNTTGSGTVWTRKFVWDAQTDVGAVKIDDVALVVNVKESCVQLWENGPYWAKCNVGASKPEETGYYFWWGDTVGYVRNAYNNGWVSVKTGESFTFSSYNCPKWDISISIRSYFDSNGNLLAARDAATTHLGAPWRMPTDAEFSSLVSKCTPTWTTRNGVYGQLFTGRGAYASKSIFLPAAGYGEDSYLPRRDTWGYYWSSTLYLGDESYGAWSLHFGSGFSYQDYYSHYLGQPVRPVRGFVPTASAGETIHLALDCREGIRRVPAEGVELCYDANWYNGGVQTHITDNGLELVSGISGTKHWSPADGLSHHLQITVIDDSGTQVGRATADFIDAPLTEGDVVVPDNWTEIPAGMFKDCIGLTSVVIPGGGDANWRRGVCQRLVS